MEKIRNKQAKKKRRRASSSDSDFDKRRHKIKSSSSVFHTSKTSSASGCAASTSHKYRQYEEPNRSSYRKNSRRNSVSSNDSQSEEYKPEKTKIRKTIPWTKHRHALNKMFFGDRDLIKRGSQEYDDFWVFLDKYQKLKQSKCAENSVEVKKSELNLPSLYSRDNKINFYLSGSNNIDDLMVQGCIFKDESEDQLSKENVVEFSSILHLYIDFLQRQKFSKLRKLREAQSNLPIANYCEEIVRTVKDNQVVLVAGDTGCGKSTQVPQYLLAAGFSKIACTQPRRIACIALCKRVAYETLNEYGSEIGYQIRFEKNKTKHSRIIFLTEGLLLRQVSTDSLLSTYDVLILDEVHERHLSCDFLLGVVKCLLHQRKDLKVVLMSATINIKLFSEYFTNCPIVQVPGRLYPIQVIYQPIPLVEKSSKSSRINPSPYVRILHQIDNKYSVEERGDLLIFLSGITEITAVSEAAKLYAEKTKRWIILPLHSTLSIAEQDKVFDYAPEGTRKCIVSTNIAETSVTIDGIRFVVDSGKVKEMSFDQACRMQRLKEFWISKASAEQRKGRAGRTGPGTCYRLYSQGEYEELMPYSTPEIQRVPLDSTLLQMIAMGLPDARLFPFLEAPPPDAIDESIQGLKSQGALTEMETLTPIGQMLSKLPVDVTFGKMLIQGSVFQQLEAVLVLAAAMSVQSPFTNRSYRDLEIMAARKSLESDHGDPFTLLNAYHEWATMKAERNYDTRKWCKRNGLEEQRFYEMTKLQRQFKELLADSKLIESNQLEASSSNERMQRHGELMKLKDIKKQLRRAPHSRKYLKLDSEIEGVEFDNESEHDETLDVHDVEFRISNDRKQIKELSLISKAESHNTLSLLKAILCSGLYPQLAIPDEHNPYKSDAEQLFHTREKPFVALHPMGCFSMKPDLLKLRELDCEQYPGFVSRFALSTKHQLLCYTSLLETTKPYLMNCMQVPAAHTLLLLSHNLDTNGTLTRIICDKWLELCFPKMEEAQQLIAQVIVIRDLWQKFLETVFQLSQEIDTEVVAIETRSMRRKLTKFISQFHRTEILHTVRRLLAADLKDVYVGPDSVFDMASDALGINEDINNYEKHHFKGGILVREYFVYNCLVGMETDKPEKGKKSWICPGCQEEFVFSLLEQVRHREKCSVLNKAEVDATTTTISSRRQQKYYCHDCRKELRLSSTDILRHKKSHANAAIS